MQSKLHFKGVWFIPEKPQTQIPGILDFNPKRGINLQLFGILNTSGKYDELELSIICGITEDGKKITLFKCLRNHHLFNSNGLESSCYQALYMFVGLLIPEHELTFKSINIQFKDFDKWLQIYGFKKNEFNKPSTNIIVQYQQPEDISMDLYKGINCKFKFSTYASNTTRLSSLTIEQVCEIVLSKGNDADFFTIFNLFHTFQMFLTLSYFERPLITTIKLKKEMSSQKHGTFDTDVQLFFQTDVTSENYKEKRSSQDFLFIYNDIRANYQEVLSKWFEAEETLSPSIYGLSEAFSKTKAAVEFSFLNIAHAIETLHRRRRKNLILPTEDYQSRIAEILNSVNSNYVNWLKAKLEFGNEPTLHDRLQELINDLPKNIKTALLKPSIENFIKDFKRSRNFYTHYNQSLEKKALKGNELFYLKERSKILLICFVLNEIGITNNELEKIIFNKGVFLFNHIINNDEAQILYRNWE